MPVALRVNVPSELVPSKKVTVPGGGMVVAASTDTVAVNVTGEPTSCGVTLDVSVVVVGVGLTTITCADDWLGRNAALPG